MYDLSPEKRSLYSDIIQLIVDVEVEEDVDVERSLAVV